MKRVFQVLQQLVVPEGGFHKNLGACVSQRILFHLLDGLNSCFFFDRKITRKSEGLPVKTGGHQGQKYGGRAGQRNHPKTVCVGGSHGQSTRVSYPRASRL